MQTFSAAELQELEEHRLDNRLSYRDLARDMKLPEATINRILNTPKVRVYETTAHVVRKYLGRLRDSRRRRDRKVIEGDRKAVQR